MKYYMYCDMAFFARMIIFLICVFMGVCKGGQEGNCPRVLEFNKKIDGRKLMGHVFKRRHVQSQDICEINCFVEPDCFSFNVGPLQDGKHSCELSDSDHMVHPEDLIYDFGMSYKSVVNFCSSNPCPVNSRCQTGFTDKGYRCICASGFSGPNCNYGVPIVQVLVHDVTTEEGNDVIMMCNATGDPLPKITWTKSERSLPVSRSIVSEGNLTILNVTMDDSGSYVCTATSIVGTNSSSVQLQVYSALKFITRPPSLVLLYTGQKLNISCVASSSLQPTVVWKLNGAASLPEGAVADASHNLIIGSVNITHAGDYICSAMNSFTSIHTILTVQVKIPETCSRVKANISDVSSDYIIDPDGEQGEASFTVYCDMTDKGGVGVTAVSHDSENKTHVSGFEPRGSYARNITYIGSSISQIKGLITASKNCQQFIKYECKGSVINGFSQGTAYFAWWLSRDGEKLNYWGEASQGCACGVTSSCFKPQRLCNCDSNNSSVWLEDSGLLTNKSHIPVSQLRFGDTGAHNEEGYYTLGKLKCYGVN